MKSTSTASRIFGARVFCRKAGEIQIVQTEKSGSKHTDRYKLMQHHEVFVTESDDAAIGKAVRDALYGRLPKSTSRRSTGNP